ncbi:MAG: Rpn family recombination-promoting nuclease/putative transposase [Fibrobacter sp.]|nr:Rpn family recombination-promoting nuclease/putative transposase [Fibrobacter sp.]
MAAENATRKIPEIFEGVKYLDPKYEPAFRELFDDKLILTDFLNTILHLKEGDKIDNLEFKFESDFQFRIPERRTVTLDIFAHTEDNRFLDIERQRAGHPFFIDRVFYYNAFLAIKAKQQYAKSADFQKLREEEQLKRRYELPETISIWICNFHPRENCNEYRDEWAVYSKSDIEHSADGECPLPVTDKIKYILLDLPNFVKYCNKMDSREMRWLYLLANAGGKEDLPDMEDDVLNQAMGRISIESASESLLKTQEHSMIAQDEIICRLAEGKLQGLEEGRAEGRAEGIVTCCGPWQLPGWQCLHRGQ